MSQAAISVNAVRCLFIRWCVCFIKLCMRADAAHQSFDAWQIWEILLVLCCKFSVLRKLSNHYCGAHCALPSQPQKKNECSVDRKILKRILPQYMYWACVVPPQVRCPWKPQGQMSCLARSWCPTAFHLVVLLLQKACTCKYMTGRINHFCVCKQNVFPKTKPISKSKIDVAI